MNFAQKFDNKLNIFQALLLSLLTKLGPFTVALMPSLFTGYAIYSVFAEEAGPFIAGLFALVAVIAIETVAIVVTHTALDLYNAWREKQIEIVKVVLMMFLIPFYVLGVAGAVYFSEDAFVPLVKALGVVSPLLTCIVYISVALAQDVQKIKTQAALEQTEQKESKKEDLAFARELKRKQQEQEHELRLKQLEATTQVQLAQVALPKQEVSKQEQDVICPFCSEEQKSIKALNAHKGHCKKRAKIEQGTNGVVAH